MRRNKAPGVDNILIELIQNSGETVEEKLFKLVKEVYESGVISEDFQKSIVIPIPKEVVVDNCNNFRTLSLMAHTAKILVKELKIKSKSN